MLPSFTGERDMEIPAHLHDRRETVAIALDIRSAEMLQAYEEMIKALTIYNRHVDFYNRALGHAAGYVEEAVAVLKHSVEPTDITFGERAMIAEYQNTIFRPVDLFNIMPIRPRTDARVILRDLPTIC